MKSNDKGVLEKSGKFSISIVLYAAAAVAALCGIVLLIDNIYIFKSTIDQYVSQGYPADTVMKSLIPSQLLPGILEPIAIYGGIAGILLGIGKVNKKITNYFAAQTDVEVEIIAMQDEAVAVEAEVIEADVAVEAAEKEAAL